MLPRKSLRKRKNWFKWLLLVGLIFFSVLVFFVLTRVLVVKNISCRLQESDCDSLTTAALQQHFLGKSLFLPKKEINTVLADSFSQYDTAKFKRNFWNFSFVFDFQLGKVIAVLKADQFYWLNENGYVLKIDQDCQDFPVINSNWPLLGLKKGDNFPQKEVKASLVIIKNLAFLGQPVETATLNDRFLQVKLKNLSTEIFFSFDSELNYQVNSLQLILNRAKMEGKVFDKIDLRFEKPIVTFYE